MPDLRLAIKNDFNFNNVNPQCFWKSEWERADLNYPEFSFMPSTAYLVYRGLYINFFIFGIIFSLLCQPYLYFIFLTNWSFCFQLIYSILAFTEVFYIWLKMKRKRNTLKEPSSRNRKSKSEHNEDVVLDVLTLSNPENNIDKCDIENNVDSPAALYQVSLLEKCLWILINVSSVLPYAVAGGYWMFVYKYNPDQRFCEKIRSHYIVHGINAVLALVDSLVIAVPIRITHFVFTSGVIIVYCSFTFLYECLGGGYREDKGYIYSVLDWKNSPAKASTTTIVGILITPLGHLIFCWCVYKIRILISSRLN